MSLLKVSFVSLTSALFGASLVLGLLMWNPTLIPIKGHAAEMNSTSEHVPSEQNLFDNLSKQQEKMWSQFDTFFDDDFFNQNDPFESLRKFRERMDDRMGSLGGNGHLMPFDSWFGDKFGGGTVDDIVKREDESFIYYEIRVEGLDGTTIETNIENGHLTITGRTEKHSGTEPGEGFARKSLYTSAFSRTFPLPTNVDEEGMRVAHEGQKIVLKFPKAKI